MATENLPERTSVRSRLRALRDWLIGGASPPVPAAGSVSPGGDAPRRLGRYRILRELGRGGMGIVYEAHDEQLGRTLAVKTLGGLTDETARKRFWREARAAASVNHPGVCPLYEVGDENGLPFIAMELLEGEPLSTRLERGPLPSAEAIGVAVPMLDALQAVHERGLVHRDLKPSNVFLTPHGVRLVDFGLARPASGTGLDSVVTESNLTGTDMIVGTPRYMAPEQVRGEGVDGRTDSSRWGRSSSRCWPGAPPSAGAPRSRSSTPRSTSSRRR